jgi:Tol biopolymer transport system component
MNADGSGITMLTHYTGGTPAWSPDGSKIVYRKDPGDLYFIGVDGTQEGRFIPGSEPDWAR